MNLTSEQLDLVTGNLLGDGSIRSVCCGNSSFSFTQKEENKEYVQFVKHSLLPFTKNTRLGLSIYKKNGGKWKRKEYRAWGLWTCRNPVFTDLRRKWYKFPETPRSPKIVPLDTILNWRIAAFWFADDGHRKNSSKSLKLCTHCFTESEKEFLSYRLLKDLGVESSLNRDKDKFYIRLKSVSYFDFVEGVSSYLSSISCLEYKIDCSGVSRKMAKTYSDEDKMNVLNMGETGKFTTGDLSNFVGCHERTIRRWLKNV